MAERDRNLRQYREAAEKRPTLPDPVICGSCPLKVACMTVTGTGPLPDGGVMVRVCPVMADAIRTEHGQALIEEMRLLARERHSARR